MNTSKDTTSSDQENGSKGPKNPIFKGESELLTTHVCGKDVMSADKMAATPSGKGKKRSLSLYLSRVVILPIVPSPCSLNTCPVDT